jgi:hypothetical protein
MLWTVTWGWEFCQLRPTFPDTPLLKHHVAHWESCRSIAPLQLLVLEIFKCVDTFTGFIVLKTGAWNGYMHRRRSRPPGAPARDHVLRTPALVYGRTWVSAVDPPMLRPLRILPPCYEPHPGVHLRLAEGPADHASVRGPAVLRDCACKGPAAPRGLKASAATSSTSSHARAAISSVVARLVPGAAAAPLLLHRATSPAGPPSAASSLYHPTACTSLAQHHRSRLPWPRRRRL